MKEVSPSTFSGDASGTSETRYTGDITHVVDHFTEVGEPDIPSFDAFKDAVLQFQKAHNRVYGAFHGYTYLPIQAFKDTKIACFNPFEAELVFKSSGTSGQKRSIHYVRYADTYQRSVVKGFTRVFGKGPFIFLAHLPEYAAESSLVKMAQILVQHVGQEGSGVFLEHTHLLKDAIVLSSEKGIPIILLGAAFGLLDLANEGRFHLPASATIVETGGMKTHKRELIRADLHQQLAHGFGVSLAQIRSEYGMCELLSQCYTNSLGLFEPPPWMSVQILDPTDFITVLPKGKTGIIAVIDLANMYSQSAILTQDLGVQWDEGFEVLGRMSESEIRGCNLLFEA